MNIIKTLALGSLICLASSCTGNSIIDTVTVESGQLQGVLTDNPEVMIFKGVPYAAAPVGELRWANPQPALHWEGVRVADSFGAPAVQRGRQPGSSYYKEFQAEPLPPTSEDCLFLNIWAPAKSVGKTSEKLPVAFWIHGGAFAGGCGNDMAFDGEAWCQRGVILVTINYRLGLLGFLSHPELSKENSYGASGNQGIYDQLAALKWVKDNIAQFGGDPDNITVMGQSAGAASVKTLVTSPLAKGMIAKAIIQSGGGLGNFLTAQSNDLTPEDYDLRGKEQMEKAGLMSLKEMRALATKDVPGGMGGTHVDGNLITKSFDEAVMDGTIMDIPYMIGSNGDDMGDMREAIDHFCEVRNEKSSQPCYNYWFDRKLPGDDQGAFHSAELWYMFHTLGRAWRPFEQHDYDLSDRMMDFWTNFAKYSNPNGKDADGEWKAYTKQTPYRQILK